MEPALFAPIAGLRRAASDFLKPGETAEASSTRTDSGAAMVFDPPRSGAADQAAALAGAGLYTGVAVSCNPATFARDAASLIGGGYRLERLAQIDQFVWTPHLELVAVFRR